MSKLKAVILAGGLGTRMREETEFRPKPMVEVGGKPVIWHIMKNLAHYGVTDFVVAAGYRGDQIADYFLNYSTRNRDFTVSLGTPHSVQVHETVEDELWTVTIAHTGLETPTGGRLRAVSRHLDADEDFMVVYGDGLANVDVSALLSSHSDSSAAATVTVVRPQSRFGVVHLDSSSRVTSFDEKPVLDSLISIGFFVFAPSFARGLQETSVLEGEPLSQLAREGALNAFVHGGFWQPMDTYRERQALQKMWESGNAPWAAWI